jgi:hypothetical protein
MQATADAAVNPVASSPHLSPRLTGRVLQSQHLFSPVQVRPLAHVLVHSPPHPFWTAAQEPLTATPVVLLQVLSGCMQRTQHGQNGMH